MATSARSFGASVIGWLIVAVIVYVLFGGILSAIRFLVRMIVFVFIVGALLWAYLRLRNSD